MAELEVSLVAAEREVWSGQARLVIARTTNGDVGIMPGHQPILSVLEPGIVTVRCVDGETVIAAVHGGFISVARDNVSILAEAAELSDEINVARAQEALERARSGAVDQHDEADDVARRAEVRLRAAGRT